MLHQCRFQRSSRAIPAILAGTLMAVAGVPAAQAESSAFSLFTPLAASVVGGSLPESAPLLLSSPNFTQRTISANDAGSLNGNVTLGGNWDMNTLNENGPSAGRYLFTPYETDQAGVKRLDLQTGQSVSIVAPGTQGFYGGDASRWTPFGSYLTGEESWGTNSTRGRLFEINNPLAAPGSVSFQQLNVLPRVAHEGLAFDKARNLYFVDEFNGGKIYRYTSATPNNGATFFAAGQTSVLTIGAGGNFETTGTGTWKPLTDANGAPLPGIPTVIIGSDTVIDGRAAAGAVGGTGFNRPEDLEIQTLANGTQRLYFGATGSHRVFSLDLGDPTSPVLKLFFDQTTIDAATGLPVGSGFLNPDNIAIDSGGNIYVLEDIGNIGSLGFDIWFAFDSDRDGVAEQIGRWASLSTTGSEPTGLYFDPFRPNVAYLNVQHAASGIDRTIEITAVPEPMSTALLGLGLLGLGLARQRRG